ncbi:hypothetical protein CR513_42885, partial [Mucuna pruriens]
MKLATQSRPDRVGQKELRSIRLQGAKHVFGKWEGMGYPLGTRGLGEDGLSIGVQKRRASHPRGHHRKSSRRYPSLMRGDRLSLALVDSVEKQLPRCRVADLGASNRHQHLPFLCRPGERGVKVIFSSFFLQLLSVSASYSPKSGQTKRDPHTDRTKLGYNKTSSNKIHILCPMSQHHNQNGKSLIAFTMQKESFKYMNKFNEESCVNLNDDNDFKYMNKFNEELCVNLNDDNDVSFSDIDNCEGSESEPHRDVDYDKEDAYFKYMNKFNEESCVNLNDDNDVSFTDIDNCEGSESEPHRDVDYDKEDAYFKYMSKFNEESCVNLNDDNDVSFSDINNCEGSESEPHIDVNYDKEDAYFKYMNKFNEESCVNLNDDNDVSFSDIDNGERSESEPHRDVDYDKEDAYMSHGFDIRKDEVDNDLKDKKHLLKDDRKKDHRLLIHTNCKAKLFVRLDQSTYNWKFLCENISHNEFHDGLKKGGMLVLASTRKIFSIIFNDVSILKLSYLQGKANNDVMFFSRYKLTNDDIAFHITYVITRNCYNEKLNLELKGKC